MFPIPTGKGSISSILQKSGIRYYYLRNLPLYTDENGKIIKYNSKGFTSKKAAEKYRQKVIIDRDEGVYKLNYINELTARKLKPKLSNAAADENYYSFCLRFFTERDNATATKESYLHLIESRFKPYFSKIAIKDLNKGLIQRFIDQHTTAIKNTFVILRQTLRKLYSLDLIPQYFYDGLIKPNTTAPLHPKQALTHEEVNVFLDYFKGHNLEYAILLLFQTGIRIGELQALYWNEVEIVDDKHGKLHINSSWGKTELGLARKSTKTKSSKRVVPFTSFKLVKLLVEAKENSNSKWVLANQVGTGPIEKKNFTNRYFKAVGKRLNINKPLSSHVARHTYISHLVNANVPYTTIAKLVGHDTTEMIIKVYAHPINDEKEEFRLVENIYL